MLRREFFAELKKLGFEISETSLSYAIDKGHVDRPEKPDGWCDYTEQHLEQFVAYLKRTARRRAHVPAIMAGDGPKPGRPRKSQSAS